MAIVEKCVAFDPAVRYQRASALAAELRRYLGRGARLVRMAKRHRRYVLAAAVLLVCSGGGLGAYVGTRPTRLELLYQRGLEEYEQGKYDQAAATFSQCMALRSGWPHAAFGRAQALRKAGKWRDARADFLALEKIDKGWSRAFAGYCGMRSNDTYGALSDFQVAHEAGLRDVGFLLNLARIYYRLQRHPLAIDVYTQVLSREPENRIAVRNRGMEYFLAVWTEKKRLPDAQAFLDAREDCRLNPDSFDASFCAAVIFGEAARKDPCFEEDAVGYLSKAMQQGMPLAMVKRYNAQLGSLVEKVDREVVAASERAPQGYVFRLGPDYLEPPEMADWDSFLRQHLRPLVAKSE